jgi:hypothetical protein
MYPNCLALIIIPIVPIKLRFNFFATLLALASSIIKREFLYLITLFIKLASPLSKSKFSLVSVDDDSTRIQFGMASRYSTRISSVIYTFLYNNRSKLS